MSYSGSARVYSILAGIWHEPAHPLHPHARIVEKRVLAKGSLSLYRMGPRNRFGARPWLLTQERKNGGRGLP